MFKKIKNFLLINTSNSQIFLKNTFWLFVGEILVRCLKLAVFVYAARVLGVTQWGIFSYAIALMALFSLLSDIGVNSVIIREKSRSENYADFIVTGFIIKVILSLASSAVFLAYSIFLVRNSEIKGLLPFMAIILFLDSLREFGFSLNRAFEEMEREAVGKIFAAILLVISAFIFINNFKTAIALSYAYIFSSAAGIFVGFIFLRTSLKTSVHNFNKRLVAPLMLEAWPLGLASILGVILINIDTVILGWYRGVDSVGIYGAAQKPIQLLYLIPSLLGIALLPIFSRFAHTEGVEMKRIVNKTIRFSSLAALVITIGAFFLGKTVILLLFGANYSAAILPFKIMSLSLLTAVPGLILSNILFVKGRQKITVAAVVTGIVLNFVFSFILIPKMGIEGAAIAATSGQIATNLVIIAMAKKILS